MKGISKKLLAIFFALFMLGACSTIGEDETNTSTDNEFVGGTDLKDFTDMDITEAKEYGEEYALKLLGVSDTSKMTKYSKQIGTSSDEHFYVGDDGTFINIYVYANEGNIWSYLFAHKGTLEIVEDYTIYGSDGSEITAKNGYSIYKVTRTLTQTYYNDTDGGEWSKNNYSNTYAIYPYLMKIVSDDLYKHTRSTYLSYDSENDEYHLSTGTTISVSTSYATIYTKQ